MLSLGAAGSIEGQAFAQGQGRIAYPNVNQPVALAAGDTVQLLNRFVFSGNQATRPPGRRLDLVYATRIPSSDSVARHAQADRVAQLFGSDAQDMGAPRLSIGICDTRACAENRAPPAAWYLYERTSRGWRRVR
jgi:hypothetical protein